MADQSGISLVFSTVFVVGSMIASHSFSGDGDSVIGEMDSAGSVGISISGSVVGLISWFSSV